MPGQPVYNGDQVPYMNGWAGDQPISPQLGGYGNQLLGAYGQPSQLPVNPDTQMPNFQAPQLQRPKFGGGGGGGGGLSKDVGMLVD